MVLLPGQPKGQWDTSILAIASSAVDGSKELLESRCSLGASSESERYYDREHKVAGIKAKCGAVWGISLYFVMERMGLGLEGFESKTSSCV